MNRLRSTLTVCIFTACAAVGCGSSDSDGSDTEGPDAATGSATVDASPGTPTADATPTPRPDADPSAPTATLEGMVSRSTEPQAGGVGNLYIAIFEQDPISAGDSAVAVGNALIENADLSASGTEVAYEVAGIPPRAEPYFIVAFLDDNNNVDMSSADAAGPDKGDLVSMQGLSSPSVVLDTATEQTFDIVLNIAMPF